MEKKKEKKKESINMQLNIVDSEGEKRRWREGDNVYINYREKRRL